MRRLMNASNFTGMVRYVPMSTTAGGIAENVQQLAAMQKLINSLPAPGMSRRTLNSRTEVCTAPFDPKLLQSKAS